MADAFFMALGATLGIFAGVGLIISGWAALFVLYHLVVFGRVR